MSQTDSNPNRARDHLANERTFLAWVRTAVANVVSGFAIGRFSIALPADRDTGTYDSPKRNFRLDGRDFDCAASRAGGCGIGAVSADTEEVGSGRFQPAGLVLDLAILTVLFGLVLAGYLIHIERSEG